MYETSQFIITVDAFIFTLRKRTILESF